MSLSTTGMEDEQEIHLRDYWHVIKKRRQVVWLFSAITFAVVLVGSLAVTSLYEAETQVLIEKNQAGDPVLGGDMLRYDPEFLQTQFEILKSNNVVARVIKKLQLDTKYRHYFLEEKRSGFLKTVVGSAKELLATIFAGESSENLVALVAVHEKSDADLIAEMIQENLKTSPIRNTKIVSIAYRDRNPAVAAMVVNGLVEAYMAEMLDIKMNASGYALRWMTSKAEEEKKKLEKSEKGLQAYRQKYDIVTVENKLVVIPQKLVEFSSQLSKAQARRNELEEEFHQIQRIGHDYDSLESIPVFATNQALQSVRDKIMAANQKIGELSKKYGPKHPLMIKAVSDRTLLLLERKREIDRIVNTNKVEYEVAKSSEKNINKLLDRTKQEMQQLNERMIQADIMRREADTNRVLYEALMKNIKQNSATENSQTVNIWVVKHAQVPESAAFPRTKLNILLGLVLGLFGGIGCAFFVEYLDNTVKSGEEVEKRFQLPLLGVVGLLEEEGKSFDSVVRDEPRSPFAESYRVIRSSLMLSAAGHPPKVILVSSVQPKEGKTATAVNIARTLAQTGGRVMLVDCDMRKPRLHSALGISNTCGLSSYLSGAKDGDFAFTVAEDKLSCIPAGPIPPNPSELLGSKRMEKLLSVLADKYDYVVLDSPPVLSVTDSQILSLKVDGVLLVCRAGETSYDQLGLGIRMFRSVQAPMLGLVLNGMSEKVGGDYYYGGYYYRQYYVADAVPSEQAGS